MTSLPRRMIAEAAGTGLLAAAIVGSGIMAANLTDNAALALLCNALATAAALTVIISVLAPVSGAHLNPAVSLVMAALGRLTWRDAAGYVVAQLAGGIAGAALAHAMFELPLLQLGVTSRAGVGAWLSEAVATGGLLGVILLASRAHAERLPQLIGLYILAAYWFTASTAFANPAITLARSLTATFTGIAMADMPGFVAAQMAAAAICAGLALLLTRSRPQLADAPSVQT